MSYIKCNLLLSIIKNAYKLDIVEDSFEKIFSPLTGSGEILTEGNILRWTNVNTLLTICGYMWHEANTPIHYIH